MADFTSLVLRLDALRQHLAGTLRDKGVATIDEETLASLVDKVALVDSTSGMNQIRNGYQLFRGNTTMSVFPELDTASFDSMFQMCYGCTALERVPTLDTSNVANMMYAFYGCTNLLEIAGYLAHYLHLGVVPRLQEPAQNRRKTRLQQGNIEDRHDVRLLLRTRNGNHRRPRRCRHRRERLSETHGREFGIPAECALSDTGNGKTCNIGTKNLAKLNAIQKAIATDKGWTLT